MPTAAIFRKCRQRGTSFLNLSKSPPLGSGKGLREDSQRRIVRRKQLNETRCDSCQNSFHLMLNASKKLPFSCLVKRQTTKNNAAGITLSSLVAEAVIPLFFQDALELRRSIGEIHGLRFVACLVTRLEQVVFDSSSCAASKTRAIQGRAQQRGRTLQPSFWARNHFPLDLSNLKEGLYSSHVSTAQGLKSLQVMGVARMVAVPGQRCPARGWPDWCHLAGSLPRRQPSTRLSDCDTRL